MELYRGTRNKEQLAQLRRRIRYFGVVRFSEAVADLATGYIEAFHLPHGLEIPDALIAATAVAYQLPLFTYNRKDFFFIPGLQLYEAQ